MSTSEVTFVDTNVLLYAHDASEMVKRPIARDALERLWADGTGAISTQVLQEFYVVATRKLAVPMSHSEAREVVDVYSSWRVITIDPSIIIAASVLEEEHTLSFWDALIVEAAKIAGASLLLSEDLQAGRGIGGIRIRNPFAVEPG